MQHFDIRAEVQRAKLAEITRIPGMLPEPAVLNILAMFGREGLEQFTEIAVRILNVMDGDSDLEASGDDEPVSVVDPLENGWGENIAQERNKESGFYLDDSEDDDPREGDDPSGQDSNEDEPDGLYSNGPGCPIADPGIADTGGLCEQLGGDDGRLTWGIDQTGPYLRCGQPS